MAFLMAAFACFPIGLASAGEWCSPHYLRDGVAGVFDGVLIGAAACRRLVSLLASITEGEPVLEDDFRHGLHLKMWWPPLLGKCQLP